MEDRNIQLIVEQLEDHITDSEIIFELHKSLTDIEDKELSFIVNKEGTINFSIELLDGINYDSVESEYLLKYKSENISSERNTDFIIDSIKCIDNNKSDATEYKETFKDKHWKYSELSFLLGIVVCFLWELISIIIAIFKFLFQDFNFIWWQTEKKEEQQRRVSLVLT